MRPIAVLGAGMAGFGAGYALKSAGVPFLCFDKNSYYGGHTWSFRYENGFVFDEGGHISFTKDNRIRDLLASNVDNRFEEQPLKADNYWHGYRITHPVQSHLHNLPTELKVAIIKDFLIAQQSQQIKSGNYSQWLHSIYGKTFAETFPIVYGSKYHTTTMDQLTTDWIGPRLHRPSLDEILHGALSERRADVHYVGVFRYPSSGGFLSYLDAFAKCFELRLNHRLAGVDARNGVLRFANGSYVPFERLISSIPLPELIPLVDGVPDDVVAASRKLAFTTAVLVNLGIGRADLSDAHVTYFYDEDIVFSRINLPHMFSANNAPPGMGTIQAEVYFSDKYRPLRTTAESLIAPVIAGLRKCGFIRENDRILLKDAAISRYANIIYDHDRAAALATVHGFLHDLGIAVCGRYGNWDHAWTDEAFISGEKAAIQVMNELGSTRRTRMRVGS